jgi:hypothetical protein
VRMGREWMFSLGHYHGGEVRKGGCGGIVNGINLGVVVLLVDDFLHLHGYMFIHHMVLMYNNKQASLLYTTRRTIEQAGPAH